MSAASPKRRWLIPEVIQTSATDCGPATLKAIASGMGRPVSYESLRMVCRTGIDGTSIDDIEQIANELELRAEQTMLPVDHLVTPRGLAHPSIVVLRDPIGEAHFVAAWRRFAGRIQLMDPTSGRRWPSADQFARELYIHQTTLCAAQWRGWAAGADFVDVVEYRLDALGLARDPVVRRRWEAVRRDPDHRPIATFDATVRLTAALVEAGALGRGPEAGGLMVRVLDDVLEGRLDPDLLDAYWFARPVDGGDDEGGELVRLRGAVLVRLGVDDEPSTLPDDPDEGDRSLDEPQPAGSARLAPDPDARSTMATVLDMMSEGRLRPLLRLGGLVLVLALGSLVEVALVHGLLDGLESLALPGQRGAGGLAVLGLTLALLGLELSTLDEVTRRGRALEGRLRLAFARALPRMRLEYFRSRLPSDLATRSQRVHQLRELPHLLRHVVLVAGQLVAMAAALVWLDPALLGPTLASLGLAAAAAALVYPPLRERDLKVQHLDGNLGNAYLDAMLGLAPAQAHAAEPALEREHQRLLDQWQRAGAALQRSLAATDGVQALVGSGAAIWLIVDHLGRAGDDAGGVILIVYLALSVSTLGAEIVQVLRALPRVRNIAERQLEPLRSPRWLESRALPPSPRPPPGACEIELESVRLHRGGQPVLDDLSLRIEASAHVAVVGPSGAGKSTLLSLLLGRHAPTAGTIRIDGRPLSDERWLALREQTAWVDPCVQLWNRSLLSNIVFGAEDREHRPLASIVAQTHLGAVLDRLDQGMQTPLGEEGRRLSGGEGQRVRLARAWGRASPRLVLLDEPFRGLERPLRDALLAASRRHWADATLLCVTHDVASTRGFDRVAVVEGGRVVEYGDPAALAEREGSAYARLLAAERALATDAWSPARWRHLNLSEGRLAPLERERPHD